MKIIQCAVCGHNKNSELLFKENIDFSKIDKNIFSARRIPDRIHYRLQRCKKCGLIFSSPILDSRKIEKLYKESEMTYDQEIDFLKKTYGYYLKDVLRLGVENPRLLEIGGGNGFFLEEVKKMGIADFWGVEPSQEAVNRAKPDIRKRMIVDFFPSSQIKNNSLDIICIFQTLDHIMDPNTFLTNCFKALKKRGLVLCILHDTDGLSVKLLKEKSPIFDIEHIYLFNKFNLQKIFEKNGFKTIKTFAVKNTFPLRYWLRMFPLPLMIKTNLIKFLRLLGLDELPLTLEAGNIGIIARK